MRVVALLVVAAVLVAAGWWAGQAALEPPEDPLGSAVATTYEVVEGTVGRSLNFAVIAEWPTEYLARAGSGGVVTSVDVNAGDEVEAGSIGYSVDLRPVTIGVGEVPMFRDLALRSEGPDVAQVQTLLSTLGFFDGDVDGVFGRDLRDAVRDWQDSNGLPDDGVVRAGDVMFVPSVPVRVVLDEAVTVGARLGGGEVTVRRVTGDPVFVIPLALEQRGLVPLDADVFVRHGSGEWAGMIGTVREDDQRGELLLEIVATDGGSLCGTECAAEVPLVGRTDYPARVVVVPETSGPVVPIAAIETAPDGATSVLSSDGSAVSVSIVEASNGIAVVDGVGVGDVILLPVTVEEPAP